MERIMGIDLRLLASIFRERRGEFLPTASLRLDRTPQLLAQFSESADPCLVRPLPPGLKVSHYEDEGLKFDDVARHGNPLTCTTPMDLRRLQVSSDVGDWNRAVLAFVLTLPADARIILYWC
jgi:hypothetical protein